MARKTKAQLQAAIEANELKQLFTYKTDIWQRATDTEAQAIDASINNSSVKQRRMWDDSLKVQHASPFFQTLRDQMIAQFGEQRADEILAPSI